MRARDRQLESKYQGELIDILDHMFPGCVILKNDSSYQQGIPDLSIFWRRRWAWLEVKPYEGAEEQPNQPYFVELASEMSFGAFIYPENEREVLNALQQSFGSGW